MSDQDAIQRNYISKIHMRNLLREQQKAYNSAYSTGVLSPLIERLTNSHAAMEAQYNDMSVPSTLKGADLVQLRAQMAAINVVLGAFDDPWGGRIAEIDGEIKAIRDANPLFVDNINAETGEVGRMQRDQAEKQKLVGG